MIEDGRTQLALQPEGEHDKAVLTILEKVGTCHARRAHFYQNQAGWTRWEQQGTCDLILVFDTAAPEPEMKDVLVPD
jgi:hypothetical protein